jgi:hypothetical protein
MQARIRPLFVVPAPAEEAMMDKEQGLFRKKPVVIEAVRTRFAIQAAKADWSALPEWLRLAYEKGPEGIVFAHDHVSITAPEGVMRAEPDDWIIHGIKGELYPCKPDIFAATYEPVEVR